MNVRRAPALMAVVMGAIMALCLTGCGSAGAGNAGPAESPKPPTTSSTTTTTKTTAVTALDGTWEVSYTRKEFEAVNTDPSQDIPENWGHFTMTFHRGDVEFTASDPSGSWSGTYVVDGNTVTLHWAEYDGALTWSIYRDQLTFTGDIPTGFRVKPWRRTGP